MTLKPSKRLKKRYISFALEGNLTAAELSRGIYRFSLKFFGEYGLSFRTIKLIEFNEGRGIFLANRDSAEEVLGMLALVTELEGKPVHIFPIATSGTLAALKEKDKVKST
jgi:RNase P/RNase MRP subunit POP5